MPNLSMPRILLVGATGYIGGTSLYHILQSAHPILSKSAISLLVRGEDRAQKLKNAYGQRVNPIVFSSLDDTEFLASTAAEHDILLNLGSGYHIASVKAMVRGLTTRLADKRHKTPWLIQLSGTTNTADSPMLGDNHPDRCFDDADPLAIYEFEKVEESKELWPQRTTELTALEMAEDTGVNALALQAGALWGLGRGLFSVSHVVLPTIFRFILDKGYGFQLGDGTGRIGITHVDDLAALVVLLTEKILDDDGKDLPRGRSGIMLAQFGSTSTVETTQRCLDAAFRNGILPKPEGPQQKEMRVVDLDEVASYFSGGLMGRHIESKAIAGHMNLTSTVAGRLGLKPLHSTEEWNPDSHLDQELKAMLAETGKAFA